MSNALAQRAIDAAFRRWGHDALYTPEGGPVRTIRVLFRQPDMMVAPAGISQKGPSRTIDIRRSEVEAPRKGEAVEIDGRSYRLGEPKQLDNRRLKWTADLLPG